MPKPTDSDTRYPGYDVLSKWSGPSWNETTRRVITQRLAINPKPRFFAAAEFQTVAVLAACIVPQPATRPPIPVAALIDDKLHRGQSDGYRLAGTPREGDAWRLGLKALDAESRAQGGAFHELPIYVQNTLLRHMQQGELHDPTWANLKPQDFFNKRMARDIVLAYYAHPTAWSEIGWGGPASPRGYVRLDFDERDPWEAAETKDGDIEAARRTNRRVR